MQKNERMDLNITTDLKHAADQFTHDKFRLSLDEYLTLIIESLASQQLGEHNLLNQDLVERINNSMHDKNSESAADFIERLVNGE